MVEFQVQIKEHNKREYEDKWHGWQNWTDEKLATKLTKDDQQVVLILPVRWWPDTLPEFESGGWWQRPHKRVRCRQCKCSLDENPSFKCSKCHSLLYPSVFGMSVLLVMPVISYKTDVTNYMCNFPVCISRNKVLRFLDFGAKFRISRIQA